MRRGICIAVLMIVALSQEGVAQRSPAFVTVIGASGKPLVGAEVICSFASNFATPLPSEVVKGTTDKRGRARCNLQLGRVYSAWAVGPKQVDGGYYASRVKQLVSSGRLIELEAHYWRTASRVKLEGVAAWRRVGAVGLRWFPVARHDHSYDLPLPDDDVVELPASPWSDGCLGLTTKQGAVLVGAKVAAACGPDLWFADPIQVAALVTDQDDKPLAGANVEFEIWRMDDQPAIFSAGVSTGMLRSLAGVTKADGTLQFHAPTTYTYFSASKPGYIPAAQIVRESGSFHLKLGTSHNKSFRFVGADASELRVAASNIEQVTNAKGRKAWVPRQLPVTNVGQGKWTVPDTGEYFRVRAAVSAKLPRAVVLDQDIPLQEGATILLAAQTTVEVRVRDTAGKEAACVLGVARAESSQLDWLAIVATSIGGVAEVVVPSDERFFVYASTGTAHAMEVLEIGKGGPLPLELVEIPTMRVHVVDNVGHSMVLVSMKGGISIGSGRQGAGQATRKELWTQLARSLAPGYIGSVSSNRNGMIDIPVFVARNARGIKASAVRGDLTSKAFNLVPGGDTEVVLQRR
tara:strand:+ start:465 stop:2192 length:1728 start_codon:yes stop_codon:yes gene_type:complete